MKYLLIALLVLTACGREEERTATKNHCPGYRSVVETGHCRY